MRTWSKNWYLSFIHIYTLNNSIYFFFPHYELETNFEVVSIFFRISNNVFVFDTIPVDIHIENKNKKENKMNLIALTE